MKTKNHPSTTKNKLSQKDDELKRREGEKKFLLIKLFVSFPPIHPTMAFGVPFVTEK